MTTITKSTTRRAEQWNSTSVPRAVPEPAEEGQTTAHRLTEEPSGFLRAFVRGSIIGAIGLFVFAAATAIFAGGEVVDALGLGAFCAFWGGPGFGGAIGASIHQGPDDHP